MANGNSPTRSPHNKSCPSIGNNHRFVGYSRFVGKPHLTLPWMRLFAHLLVIDDGGSVPFALDGSINFALGGRINAAPGGRIDCIQ
jgi:hypothetical protein